METFVAAGAGKANPYHCAINTMRPPRRPLAWLPRGGGILVDPTKPYGVAESVFYDLVVAPAMMEMVERAAGRFVPHLPDEAAVLDVGCGGGQLLVALADSRPDLRLTGVDLSPQQVAAARRRSRHLGGRVHVVEGSALDLPFEDRTFDVVISVASVKHWPQRSTGLRECVRVLRPGGELRVAEADRGCRYEDARAFVGRWRIPRALRPFALQIFRTYIAGKALDLDDARSLLEQTPLDNPSVGRVDGTPALVMTGRAPV